MSDSEQDPDPDPNPLFQETDSSILDPYKNETDPQNCMGRGRRDIENSFLPRGLILISTYLFLYEQALH